MNFEDRIAYADNEYLVSRSTRDCRTNRGRIEIRVPAQVRIVTGRGTEAGAVLEYEQPIQPKRIQGEFKKFSTRQQKAIAKKHAAMMNSAFYR